ncbi:hypothetical protein [Bradyrhizobium prioriisuperbiae]|uniref:hypothetical protein n=1 Tax=Bradyrhizobium prioriisuperbiae TaxID=2854389 RepID=UPI0028E63ADF|nr:hypothetical protein [Bradyrhizobium prioritasuperba]
MNSPFAAAAHIGPACLELKRLAEKADLKLLAHLLDMASLQASKDQLATAPGGMGEKRTNTVQLRTVRGSHAASPHSGKTHSSKIGEALR